MSHHFVSASPPQDASPPPDASPPNLSSEESVLVERLTEILQTKFPTKHVRERVRQLILKLSE